MPTCRIIFLTFIIPTSNDEIIIIIAGVWRVSRTGVVSSDRSGSRTRRKNKVRRRRRGWRNESVRRRKHPRSHVCVCQHMRRGRRMVLRMLLRLLLLLLLLMLLQSEKILLRLHLSRHGRSSGSVDEAWCSRTRRGGGQHASKSVNCGKHFCQDASLHSLPDHGLLGLRHLSSGLHVDLLHTGPGCDQATNAIEIHVPVIQVDVDNWRSGRGWRHLDTRSGVWRQR